MDREPSSLIERLLGGDNAGFDDVVAWYSEDVLRLCYLMLLNREEALDALQDTFLRFVQRVRNKQFVGQNGSVKGFLLTCARNLCIDRLRKRKNFLLSLEENSDEFDCPQKFPTPGRLAEESQFQDAFERALAQLSDSQRAVLVLFDIQGDSYAEIANTLHISLVKVKSDLHRARRKLRQLLEPFGEEP